MLDLNTLDLLTGSEEGRWCYPVHPRTGATIKLADGKPWGFLLLGRHSAVARDALRALSDERAAMEAQGRTVTELDATRMNAEFMAKVTKAWSPMTLDGAEFPCTYENALKLYQDPRFRWIEPQLRAFVMSDGPFFPN